MWTFTFELSHLCKCIRLNHHHLAICSVQIILLLYNLSKGAVSSQNQFCSMYRLSIWSYCHKRWSVICEVCSFRFWQLLLLYFLVSPLAKLALSLKCWICLSCLSSAFISHISQWFCLPLPVCFLVFQCHNWGCQPFYRLCCLLIFTFSLFFAALYFLFLLTH